MLVQPCVLARQVLLAYPIRKRPQWLSKDQVEWLHLRPAWSRLGVEPAELSEIAVECEVFRFFLGLLPPRFSPKEKRAQKWVNEWTRRPRQWRSKAKCRPGPTIKCRPFNPSNLLTKILNERRSCLCLFKAIRMNKASSKSQSNTNKLKWVLFCIVEYESCFFCLSPRFLLLIFQFLLSLHMHRPIRTPHVSSNFPPCRFLNLR